MTSSPLVLVEAKRPAIRHLVHGLAFAFHARMALLTIGTDKPWKHYGKTLCKREIGPRWRMVRAYRVRGFALTATTCEECRNRARSSARKSSSLSPQSIEGET